MCKVIRIICEIVKLDQIMMFLLIEHYLNLAIVVCTLRKPLVINICRHRAHGVDNKLVVAEYL